MKTIEIIGYKRANLGKTDSQRLREEGHVPCVLYGGGTQVHFYSPMILFRDLVYTNEAHFVHLNVEGEECQAILQDIQFHPISEIILHADFLRIVEDKKIKMNIPTRIVGLSPGVVKGGALVRKKDSLSVLALPKDMPDHIDVDISDLDFHHAVKVGDLAVEGLELLDTKSSPIVVVEVPRAAKMEEEQAATVEAAPAEGAATAPAAEPKKEEGKK
jgi:large subunit ribosomal protein L25